MDDLCGNSHPHNMLINFKIGFTAGQNSNVKGNNHFKFSHAKNKSSKNELVTV